MSHGAFRVLAGTPSGSGQIMVPWVFRRNLTEMKHGLVDQLSIFAYSSIWFLINIHWVRAVALANQGCTHKTSEATSLPNHIASWGTCHVCLLDTVIRKERQPSLKTWHTIDVIVNMIPDSYYSPAKFSGVPSVVSLTPQRDTFHSWRHLTQRCYMYQGLQRNWYQRGHGLGKRLFVCELGHAGCWTKLEGLSGDRHKAVEVPDQGELICPVGSRTVFKRC